MVRLLLLHLNSHPSYTRSVSSPEHGTLYYEMIDQEVADT